MICNSILHLNQSANYLPENKMANSFTNKPERPWPNPYLEIASIVGHTTAQTSRLWFRTHVPGKYQVLVFSLAKVPSDQIDSALKASPITLNNFKNLASSPSSGAGNPVQAISFTTDVSNDTTAVIDLSGLTEDSHYRYLLWSEDQQLVVFGHQRQLTFRTLSNQAQSISFGFFSCHMPYKKTLFGRTQTSNEQMWDYFNSALTRHNEKDLRFVIAGGDQVYSDGIDTLNIWKYLQKVMRREGGKLLPEVPEMVSWYRDIYRGYWGFQALREVYSRFPTYMIWDDHEIADGWGSFRFQEGKRTDELNEILPNSTESDHVLNYSDRLELVNRMFTAARQVYFEYQHSHNPFMPSIDANFTGQEFDYHFSFPKGAVYVLDGRGHRDFNRSNYKILGVEQFERFRNWLSDLSVENNPYVFIVAAVPFVHLSHVLVNRAEGGFADLGNLTDDLRDSWEHPAHKIENKKILGELFKAAKKGHRICILSGDVHTAAAFRLTDPLTGCVIYQLTSSAITYNKSRLAGWALGQVIPDEGTTRDGYQFKRLARYTDSNFSLLRLNPLDESLDFQFYGEQVIENPNTGQAQYNSHSIAKLELTFPQNK